MLLRIASLFVETGTGNAGCVLGGSLSAGRDATFAPVLAHIWAKD